MPTQSYGHVLLEAVLVTQQLALRDAPPPDREAEVDALHAIGRAMADGSDAALRVLVETALALCHAGSAGVSLLDEQADAFRWVAMAGAYAPLVGGATPGRFSPCGTALERGSPQLYAYPERVFTYLGAANPTLVEGLVVPFRADGVAGTIWVAAHDDDLRFTAEDARLLTSLAGFTATVLSQAERRLAQERLARAFDTTLSAITDFAYTFDRDGRFVFVNKALLDLWGLTLGQAVGKNFFDLKYPPGLAARLQRQIQEVFETARPLTDETPYTSPTGAGGYYEYIFTPVLAADGTVEAVAGSTRDITRRKAADAEREALRASLEAERFKLAALIGQAPAFICTLRGPEHVIEIANEQYYGIVGRRDIIGRTVREALPELEGQGFFELLDNVYRTGVAFTGNQMPVLLSRGGDDGPLDQRYMNFVYQPTRDADGTVSGIFVHGVDVTDLVRAQELIRQSEARFRLIADAMPQIVWVTRPDGYHEYYNRRWYEYLGLDFEQTKGDGWAGPLHPDDRERARARWRQSLETGEAYEIEYRFRRHDGQYRWFLGRAAPVRDERGSIVKWYGTCTDVDEQKRLRDEREQMLEGERTARAEAEAANRSKDRHLAFLAHELRGPLTPALLASAAMATDAGLPESVRSDAAMIRRNIELTTQLADDLLDANRVAHGKLELRIEPVDVHETLRASVLMCQAEASGRQVRLVLELLALRYVTEGDAAKLIQVWCNLLKNAVKFSHVGGTVTIGTSDAARGLRVEVCDAGVGVSPELLPKLFDLYEQGDRSVTREYSGLGLGLAICKGIINAHRGTIVAFSGGKGRGATLTVELAAREAAVRPPLPDAPRGAVAADNLAQGLRILLVDDDEDTLRVMARLLGGVKHRVTTATGVGAALSATDDVEFDLLISDVGLGDGTGLDLMRELLKRRPIRGIALTGYGTASDVEATRAAGFIAHLTKPVNFEQLQTLILDIARSHGQ